MPGPEESERGRYRKTRLLFLGGGLGEFGDEEIAGKEALMPSLHIQPLPVNQPFTQPGGPAGFDPPKRLKVYQPQSPALAKRGGQS